MGFRFARMSLPPPLKSRQDWGENPRAAHTSPLPWHVGSGGLSPWRPHSRHMRPEVRALFEERYHFVVSESHSNRPAVVAFKCILTSDEVKTGHSALGFVL